MQDNVLLSICISSYNKGQKCRDLVNGILGLNDERIDIVICDDCSDGATTELLRTLQGDRVKVFFNPYNLGACPNWYETLDRGSGKYLLHVLDRDYIDIDVLRDFVDYLEHCNAGVGYIGNYYVDPLKVKNNGAYDLYSAGEKSGAEIGGILLHPTGFFVRKDAWDAGEFKKYFYDENTYGIYPHSYLVGIIGLQRDVLLVRYIFCRYVYSQSSKSGFYKKKSNAKYWWEPESVFSTCEKMVTELSKFYLEEEYKRQFIENAFKDSVFRATIGYRRELIDKRQMAHYSLETQDISLARLFAINIAYTAKFIKTLENLGIVDWSIKKGLIKASHANMKDIISYY